MFQLVSDIEKEKNAGNPGYGAGDEKDPNQDEAQNNRGGSRKLSQVLLHPLHRSFFD